MPAHKGTIPPSAGKGRKKGVPNKITTELKDMILGALSDAGGKEYLTVQARKNPQAFLALLGKCIPKDLNVRGAIGYIDVLAAIQGRDANLAALEEQPGDLRSASPRGHA